MDQLPAEGFIRESQIITDPKKNQSPPPPLPFGHSLWWEGVRAKVFPPPVKLGPNITAWAVDDIRILLAAIRSGELVLEHGLQYAKPWAEIAKNKAPATKQTAPNPKH